MTKNNVRNWWAALGLLAAFALFTAALTKWDVSAIGPRGSTVGFASVNGAVHRLLGVHYGLYVCTDWLSLAAVAVACGFAVLGLCQLIRRKSLRKVDADILLLGGFYLAVIAAYLFFEGHVVNYRPVLIENRLEASYPSSTTMLVLCVMVTAMLQFHRRISNQAVRRAVNAAAGLFTAAMVAGRLLSGVHWIADIAGGMLLSAGLILVYYAASQTIDNSRRSSGRKAG